MKSLHFSTAVFLALVAWPLAANSAPPMNVGQPHDERWIIAQSFGGPCVPGSAALNDPASSPCPPGYAPSNTPGLVPSAPQPSGAPGAPGTTGLGATPGIGVAPGVSTTPSTGTTPGVGTLPGIGSPPLIDSTSGVGTGLNGSNGVGSTTNNVGVSPYGGSSSFGAPMGTTQPGGLSR